MKVTLCILASLCLNNFVLHSQNYHIPLWNDPPNQIASSEEEQQEQRNILWITKVQKPDISVYLPAKEHATGQAVVICPGGGYGGLAYDWEGSDIAKWFNSKGVAGIVLKYRLPSPEYQPAPRLAPSQDVKQAMRLVRKHAGTWNIDPRQVGVMGFSAGGHLASTLGTQWNDPQTNVANQLTADNARPDFMILIYPVISMTDDITHKGSRENLLGPDPTQEMKDQYSNEKQVTEQTPPTFLIHSANDLAVPAENSIRFYQALTQNGVPSELHLYPTGGHGYSLALDDGHLKQWPELLIQWMSSLNELE